MWSHTDKSYDFWSNDCLTVEVLWQVDSSSRNEYCLPFESNDIAQSRGLSWAMMNHYRTKVSYFISLTSTNMLQVLFINDICEAEVDRDNVHCWSACRRRTFCAKAPKSANFDRDGDGGNLRASWRQTGLNPGYRYVLDYFLQGNKPEEYS